MGSRLRCKLIMQFFMELEMVTENYAKINKGIVEWMLQPHPPSIKTTSSNWAISRKCRYSARIFTPSTHTNDYVKNVVDSFGRCLVAYDCTLNHLMFSIINPLFSGSSLRQNVAMTINSTIKINSSLERC